MSTLTAALRDALREHRDRPAVWESDRSWSYAELAAAAGSLAPGLGGERGVVAVLAGTRVDTLVGLLAAALAGQAWLLLDPAFPAPRTAAILARVRPRWLVVDGTSLGLADEIAGDAPRVVLGRTPDRTPTLPEPGPTDLAAVMVTSGSTGAPRGVAHTQAGLAWHARNLVAVLGLGPEDRLSAIPSPMFAASTSDHLPALLAGACLHPFDARRQSLDDLTRLVRERALTTLLLGPTLFRRWTSAPGSSLRDAAALRWVRCGGEPSARDDRSRFLEVFPPTARMVATYGASEVHGIGFGVVGAEPPTEPLLSVGPPLPGVHVRVVDGDVEVGPGEVGELWVSSPGLAAGYVDDPGENERRFVTRDGRRWWRSGDRARRGEGDRLTVLGRVDERLKIRGEVVVPAVVEALLREVGVREAAVGPAPGPHGEEILAAWVVAGAEAFRADAARARLRPHLPPSAIPTAWVVVDSLPRTPGGKVDRAALPAPGPQRPPLPKPPELPRDPTERAALFLTQAELGLRGTGVTDDFFDLGGDSVRLVGLLGRVSATFGRAPDPAAYLADPTPRGLARWLCAERPPSPVHWVREGDGPVVVWCHGDYNGAGLYLVGVSAAAPHLPILSVAPHGLVHRRIPSTVAEMAAELVDDLVRRLPPGRRFLIGGHCNGAAVALELAPLLAGAGRPPGSVVLLAPPPRPTTPARPPPPRTVATPAQTFAAWSAVLAAHVPTRWPGELRVWIPRRLEWDAAPWAEAGPRARVVTVPGNHHGCVTEHREALARGLAHVAARVAR